MKLDKSGNVQASGGMEGVAGDVNRVHIVPMMASPWLPSNNVFFGWTFFVTRAGASLLGARTLLGAPGRTTRSK